MSVGFGIDVGGSGIKGALVDIVEGKMLTERLRIVTPQPATPDAVIDVIEQILTVSHWDGPVGCTLPGVVQNGIVRTATHIDESWLEFDGESAIRTRLNRPVSMLNDADAAGIAEMEFGAGKDFRKGSVVLLLTFGTGIGSALFADGKLVPNTELGDLELDGRAIEAQAAGRLREEGIMDWPEWIERVQRLLSHLDVLFWPDLIIFGGGISQCAEQFLPKLNTRARLVPAKLLNNAGIVGAAHVSQSGAR